jgi:Mrp family chromosome partitioning ATPase
MATSKRGLGWRTRRRSRLSIVERAVPRLGRAGSAKSAARLATPERPSPSERAATNALLSAVDAVARAEPPVPEPPPSRPVAEAPPAPPPRRPALVIDWQRWATHGWITPHRRDSVLAQELRILARTVVDVAFAEGCNWRDRIIVVTSPDAGTGKTFTAAQLAVSLTEGGERPVVLIDACASGVTLGHRFDAPPTPGLTDLLAAPDVKLDAVLLDTDRPGLQFLPLGVPRDHFAELVASRGMVQMLRGLTANENRLIVIDAAALLEEPAAAVLGVIAGQVMIVVEAGRTRQDTVARSLERLGDHPNVSLLLNRRRSWRGEAARMADGWAPAPGSSSALAQRRRLRRRAKAATAALLAALGLGHLLLPDTATPSRGDVVPPPRDAGTV